MGAEHFHHGLVQLLAEPGHGLRRHCPSSLLIGNGKMDPGTRPGAGSNAAAGKPVPSGEPRTPRVPLFSELFPHRAVPAVGPPVRDAGSTGTCAPGIPPAAPLRGVFMLCVPVRCEGSSWTSLGHSNVLKRKIERKKTQALITPI